MSRNERCYATLAEFGALLGYQDKGAADPSGFRCHNAGRPMHKDALQHLYMEGDVIYGNIKYLLPTWYILNRIFRDTVAAKGCNFDQIHGYQVDLLVNTYRNRGKGIQLDVMDYMWNEMTLIAILRRVPAYCPYVMALILNKSIVTHDVLPTLRLVQHKAGSLQVKNHETPDGAQNLEEDLELFGDEEIPRRTTRSHRGSRKGKEVAEPEAPG